MLKFLLLVALGLVSLGYGIQPAAALSPADPIAADSQCNAGDAEKLVPQIGSIMRTFGTKNNNPEWEDAAKLQDLWLTFPKHSAMPVSPEPFDYSHAAWPMQTGITIDWILKNNVNGDGRAQSAFMMLQANLVSDAAGEMQAVIQKQVNRLFASTAANTVQLGNLKWAPGVDLKAFHAQHAQRIKVTSDYLTTPIDPLLGALGTFNFYAIPVGQARKRADGKADVKIDDFVIYVIDSFDFEGDQKLGFFKTPDVISKNPLDGTLITNETYRNYRASAVASGKGGDFLVVTDTRTVHLPKTFTFMPELTINGTWTSSDVKQRFEIAINGSNVEWTEKGLETSIVYKKTLSIAQEGDGWRILRPNNDQEVLKMLGFGDANIRQEILNAGPQPSILRFKLQGSQLVVKWHGIRVKKTPQGAFQSLVQPEAPGNTPGDYTLTRIKPAGEAQLRKEYSAVSDSRESLVATVCKRTWECQPASIYGLTQLTSEAWAWLQH